MPTVSPVISDDIYSDSGSGTYKGSLTTLEVSSTRQSYIQIDLSSIPAGSTITSAPLTLTLAFAVGASNGGTVDIKRSESAVSEAVQPVWSSRPLGVTVSGQASITTPNSAAAGTQYTVDIAPVLNAILASGNNYGITLVNGTGTRSFASSDHATTGYRPTISITYSTASVPVTVTAGVVGTASALAPDATATITPAANTFVTKLVTADENKRLGGTTIVGVTLLKLGFDGTYHNNSYFKLDLTGLPTSVESAIFKFDASVSGVPFTVAPADTAWTEGTAPTPTMGATVASGTTVSTINSSSLNSIDITGLVNEWLSGARTNNGFGLLSNGATTLTAIGARDTNDTGYERPSLAVSYYVPGTDAGYTAQAATASALAVDATVAGGQGVTHLASPATASTALVEPAVVPGVGLTLAAAVATASAGSVEPAVAVSTDPDVTFAATALTASAAMNEAAFSSFTEVLTASAVASADLVTPTFSVEKNAVILAGSASASATIVPVEEEQGEAADPYYVRIASQSNSDDIWLRLDERTGTLADNRLGGSDATYMGNPTLGVFGLENRRGVALDGLDDYIQLTDNNVGTRNGSLEIVFKTDDAYGSLMYGIDDSVPNPVTGIGTVGATFITEVGVSAGKVFVRFNDGTQFFGTRLVNDNAWHHLVVTWVNTRLQVFLDGKLHFSRHLIEGQNIVAVPDTIGVGLKGEVMEFVFHTENVLTETEAIGNYYAAFGVTPVLAGVASASADMGQSTKGKGNQKRALALFYNTEGNAMPNYWDQYNWTGLQTSATLEGYLKVDHYGKSVPFDLGEFKVFPKSIQRDESKGINAYLGGRYYDEITGDPRYIDISTDIDTSDYDLVFFINLPARLNYAAGYGDEPSALARLHEDLIEGVRKAQDEDGFSIWAPQPEVAIALGVVDRVEAHTMGRESKNHPDQGNALGLYDWRGWQIDPFREWTTYTLAPPEYHYFDTHALNKFRVVANVEGFTDLKGWRVKDYFYGRPRDNFKVPFEGWKYEELTNGLTIGMTEYYQQDFYNYAVTAGGFGAFNKRRSVVAVPAENVKAGTVVTREAATQWVEHEEVANPYKDYATAIVVQPGDSLKGRPVNGRIFVSFMAGVDDNMPELIKQVVPEGAEPDEFAEFDYTSFRVDKAAVGTTGKQSEYGSGTSGLQSGVAITAAIQEMISQMIEGAGENIFGVIEQEKYPTERLKRFTLIERAFNWLAKRVAVAAGDKVVRAGAASATATAPAPVIRAERDAEITVAPMVALAEIRKPAQALDPDVVVRTLPATATAAMTGYGKAIEVPPMTAHAEIVENFDMIHSTGEQVVLYLHSTTATLFLKEDA